VYSCVRVYNGQSRGMAPRTLRAIQARALVPSGSIRAWHRSRKGPIRNSIRPRAGGGIWRMRPSTAYVPAAVAETAGSSTGSWSSSSLALGSPERSALVPWSAATAASCLSMPGKRAPRLQASASRPTRSTAYASGRLRSPDLRGSGPVALRRALRKGLSRRFERFAATLSAAYGQDPCVETGFRLTHWRGWPSS
jgi:hypothetical protein